MDLNGQPQDPTVHQVEGTISCGGTSGHVICLGQGTETIFPVCLGGGCRLVIILSRVELNLSHCPLPWGQ